MTTQPEALRLADALEKHLGGNTATKAATELRRLYEANQELLAALKALLADAEDCGGYSLPIHEKARAAIALAERNMK